MQSQEIDHQPVEFGRAIHHREVTCTLERDLMHGLRQGVAILDHPALDDGIVLPVYQQAGETQFLYLMEQVIRLETGHGGEYRLWIGAQCL